MVTIKNIDEGNPALGCFMCCVDPSEMSEKQAKVEQIRGLTGCFSCVGGDLILSVTTLVLGILGGVGVLNASTLGWSLIGVAGGRLLVSLANSWNLALTRMENHQVSRRNEVLGAITLLAGALVVVTPSFVFGGLGVGGVMTAKAVGWTLFGTTLATSVLFQTAAKFVCCRHLSKG